MIVYLTTNKVNGKKYIGMDTKDNPSYFGSGLIFKQAFSKYGKDNFEKIILERCESFEELCLCEKKWIEYYNAVKSNEFYNISDGGKGGNVKNYMSDDEFELFRLKISNSKKGIRKGIPLSDKNKHGISLGLLKFYKNGGKHPNSGKKMKDETKVKISKSNKGRVLSENHISKLKESFKNRNYSGENNPFYGKGYLNEGDKNPMFGKSFFDQWVILYGEEEAIIKLKEYKRRKSKYKFIID